MRQPQPRDGLACPSLQVSGVFGHDDVPAVGRHRPRERRKHLIESVDRRHDNPIRHRSSLRVGGPPRE